VVATVVIGDTHGCLDELLELLDKTGFGKCVVTGKWTHPSAHKIVFLGDLIDRGYNSIGCLKLAMELVESGIATLVRSNHDDKLRRYLRDCLGGIPIRVKISHDFSVTLEELGREDIAFKERLYKFLDSLPYWYEDDKMICVHAAYVQDAKEKNKRELALVGETNGQKDRKGYPIRTYGWMERYTGSKIIIHGHDVVGDYPRVGWSCLGTEVVALDTGAVYGGFLTACRVFPDQTFEFIQVKAKEKYSD
jgi:protein phosphatase